MVLYLLSLEQKLHNYLLGTVPIRFQNWYILHKCRHPVLHHHIHQVMYSIMGITELETPDYSYLFGNWFAVWTEIA